MEQTAALLQDALEKVQKQYPETVSGQVCYLQSDASWENVWEKTFTEHEVIIFPMDGYWVKYEIFIRIISFFTTTADKTSLFDEW
mgnify:CR=1 FL=1